VACYRFTPTPREHSEALATCLDNVLASLRERYPNMRREIAIDGSDLPAYANGQRLHAEVQSWLNDGNYTVRYEFDLDARIESVPAPTAGFHMLGGSVFISGQGPAPRPRTPNSVKASLPPSQQPNSHRRTR
jgi:hypothetical protein